MAVMAQASCAPSLQSKVEDGGVVDRMLQRSGGLDAHFLENMGVAKNSRVFVIPDEIRIANIVQKVAFGLYCHRYTPKTIPSLNAFLALKPIHDSDRGNFIFMMAHTERFRPRPWKHLQTVACPSKGKIQVFDYMFVRNWVWGDFGRLFCIMRFHETIWAAVRCPYPPNRKNAKRRVGIPHSGQGLLWSEFRKTVSAAYVFFT
ncbi:hypothetical protein [Nitrosospira sp. Nsp1]|uniref:hypothetical protein n=1 Tax=Nitrosospira sp. Nsp1 TaxID=136547 RepID=UPI00115FC276|nr:hypothetical protein [Nitrosospira sp. Nsp1]